MLSLLVKLVEGVTIDRILDDIRDSVSGTIEREHLYNVVYFKTCYM